MAASVNDPTKTNLVDWLTKNGTAAGAKWTLPFCFLLSVFLNVVGCTGECNVSTGGESGYAGFIGRCISSCCGCGYQPAFGFASGLSGRWFHDGRATSISVAPDGRNLRADDTRTRKSSIESEYNYMKMKSFILRLV